jgi:hypothetical protein
MIKLLNVVFVFSMGSVTLWLLIRSLASGRVRRSSPSKRAELFLRISRNKTPFLNILLNKSHYLIGRGPECDIPLKGMGIPLRVGEMYQQDDHYVFRNFHDNSVMINNEPIGKEARKILPGDEIMIYNYTIKIQEEKNFSESLRSDRQGEEKGKE